MPEYKHINSWEEQDLLKLPWGLYRTWGQPCPLRRLALEPAVWAWSCQQMSSSPWRHRWQGRVTPKCMWRMLPSFAGPVSSLMSVSALDLRLLIQTFTGQLPRRHLRLCMQTALLPLTVMPCAFKGIYDAQAIRYRCVYLCVSVCASVCTCVSVCAPSGCREGNQSNLSRPLNIAMVLGHDTRAHQANKWPGFVLLTPNSFKWFSLFFPQT